MNTHSKARTTPWSRGLLVDRIRLQGWTVAHAAERASVSVRTGYKWLARARTARLDLRDRPSVPGRMPRLTDSARTDLIVLLRRCHASGPAIARQLEMPRSTVARVLKREGLGRWKPSREVVVRYQRQRPGELIHLDIKKLARITSSAKPARGSDFNTCAPAPTVPAPTARRSALFRRYCASGHTHGPIVARAIGRRRYAPGSSITIAGVRMAASPAIRHSLGWTRG